MKKKLNFWNTILVICLVVSFLIQSSSVIYAGSLTHLKNRLNRLIENQTTGIIHTVVFRTQNAVSGGDGNNKVIMIFPDADDEKWCRTAGTDLSVTGCAEDGANPLQGVPNLTARCVKGTGTTNYDTIYIEQVNNLLAATTYCLQISDGVTAKLGTPSAATTGVITLRTNNSFGDVDSGRLPVDIITADQVFITASVPDPFPPPPLPPAPAPTPAPAPAPAPVPVPAPDTKVVIQGKAHPLSLVTVLQDGRVVTTTRADSLANFRAEITNITAGIWTFGIWAEDREGIRSITFSFTTNVRAGMTTTISGIFLPPTIELSETTLQRGETLNILGMTAPESEVSIFINSPEEIVKKTQAETDGTWFYDFDTTPLLEGVHGARARARHPDGLLSTFSQTLAFSIGRELVTALCPKADLNKDGRVNLVDFSILLFWWGRHNTCADQNQDGRINLIDFSIMMYWWTG